jgi:hypothetical protein
VRKFLTNIDLANNEILNAVLNGATIKTVDAFPENPSAGMLVVSNDQIYMYGDHVSDGNLSWSRIASYARVNLVENRVQGHINDEVARATAAEATLQSNIDTAAATAQTNLQDAIASEASARSTADAGLQSSIESILVTNSTLSNDLATEVSNRAAADSALGGRIDSEVSRATGAETALGGRIDGVSSDVSTLSSRVDLVSGNVTDEVSRATAAETALGGRVDSVVADLASEVSRAQGVEAGLSSSIASGVADAKSYADDVAAGAQATALADANAYTDNKVAALVDGAPELLNTLHELATAITTDESAAAALATQVGERVRSFSGGSATVTGEFSQVIPTDFTQHSSVMVQVFDSSMNAVEVGIFKALNADGHVEVTISGNTGGTTETLYTTIHGI